MSQGLQPGFSGAFMADGFAASFPIYSPSSVSQLKGVRLAVKDVFEVQGLTCGAGNPSWLQQQAPAQRTAEAVHLLLASGCSWMGKTVTDELTYSLAGINAHYGTPINPAAPDRLPGGSSSGSAVAVAAGHADLALGTDCGGSVRLPASYCGLWGIRPTHGQVETDGCFTLAPSFDTVGLFARDAKTLIQAFSCIKQVTVTPSESPLCLWVSDDIITLLEEPVQDAFEGWLKTLVLPYERLPAGTLALEAWAAAFRVLQAAEVWKQHGDWATRTSPVFGQDIASRFAAARQINANQVLEADLVRRQAQQQLSALLNGNRLLLLPPVPGVAPKLDESIDRVNEIRARAQKLLCMAGLAGLPQVVMPWTSIDQAPIGLSLIGSRDCDEQVLNTASNLYQTHIFDHAEHSDVS